MIFTKKSVDPDSIGKDSSFPDNFKICIEFESICHNCKPTDPMQSICKSCKPLLRQEIDNWKIIEAIL